MTSFSATHLIKCEFLGDGLLAFLAVVWVYKPASSRSSLLNSLLKIAEHVNE
jgi:hypothetical protein